MRILVTAGPTREYLDPVRYLSNASTGRMGYAIAEAGLKRGAEVVLISGPVELPVPTGVLSIPVVNAAEMLSACLREFPACDAAVMSAAVCDYRPRVVSSYKLKKNKSLPQIELEPTEDVCARLGGMKGHRVVVGFALEDREGEARAAEKLRQKNCDAIVLNGLGSIGGDIASVRILDAATGWMPEFRGRKAEIAGQIVDILYRLANQRQPAHAAASIPHSPRNPA